MRIAVIGQSAFGRDVYNLLQSKGHDIVGVFTIPDVNGKPDPLAIAAQSDGVPLFKYPKWRLKGKAIEDVVNEYQSCKADLNVMPFCSQFIPMEVIDAPKHGSIIYHPSILPRHRGASAINWTLIEGDPKAGFTIFFADDGLDTGPILLTRECTVRPDDTVDSIYTRFLYPQGVKAMGEAVDLIEKGRAPKIIQPTEGATYDAMLKKNVAEIDWSKSASDIHNFIRGCDMVPGAWTKQGESQVTLYGSTLWTSSREPRGEPVSFPPLDKPAIRHRDGLLLTCADGQRVNVKSLSIDGKLMSASKYGSKDQVQEIILTEEEKGNAEKIRGFWAAILNKSPSEIEGDLDFFKSGAASMDVTRLVEEIRDACGVQLSTEHVYMATTFDEFIQLFARRSRGEGDAEFTYDAVKLRANNMDLEFPNQLFINNEFVNARSGKTIQVINPADESVICDVQCALAEDVDDAVDAAKAAYEGEWGKMNARDRGALMTRLADLLEEHKEELATLETLDSGAVYTLALKTHIGMSIDTWRYYAGWCDKIQGSTIPINNARPNKNLTYTKREPYGVVGLIVPWNYPFMMLSWKMGAAIAAGNTVVLKPAQVTTLTAIKFGELVAKAGFPPGVINILPGTGSKCGQRILDHPDIRKVGFTGSTDIGKVVMRSCAESNLKKCSLELGGKSPLIVFSDCDMERAVRYALSGCFFNKGENCIAAGRLFIEDSIHDEFVKQVIAETAKMKIGDPLDRSVSHGPQNHLAHLQSLLAYIDTGVKEGAKLVYGGKRLDRPGYFLEPTIFTDVQDHMFVAKEESFGPIMIISKFDEGDVEGMLDRANASEFGLASGVFTNSINKALHVADRLQAGTVFVNTYNKTDVAAPFGGFKQSGFGKDLGQEALNEYLKTKTVTVEY